MTLRQEAHSMIDALPSDASLRYVIEMMRNFSRFSDDNAVAQQNQEKRRKLDALNHMEELRRQYPIPRDYDFDQARREAMEEKYGRFT